MKCLFQFLKFLFSVFRVENVLWRVQNGELDFNTKIKAVVLFVGTNNIDCTPHEIFEGILEIIKEIKHRLGDITIIIPVSDNLKLYLISFNIFEFYYP